MKKFFRPIYLVTALIFIFNIYASADGKIEKPTVKAKNALFIDNNSQKVLFSQNADEKIEPGGFAKIMTAIIALENMVDAEETVVADGDTIAAYDYSFGNMGILAGETLKLGDLIYGMLLYDAGDAAEVIASYSLESRSKFIKAMNEKAVSLGALNTKFTNPSGYPDEKQYTTLEDMQKITKYAMSISSFAEIVNTGMHEIAPTNKYYETRYLPNSNKFITRYSSDKYYTSKAKGVKTSYISDKNCGLILYYEDKNASFTCLVANSPYDGELNHSYEDTKALLKYGLNYYKAVKVISKGDVLAEVSLKNGKGVDRILLEAPEELSVNLPSNYDESKIKVETKTEEKIKAPITKGQALGVVKVMYDGEEYASLVLTSPQGVEADNIKGVFKSVMAVLSSPTLLVTLGILLIIFVWSTLIFNRKKQTRRKR